MWPQWDVRACSDRVRDLSMSKVSLHKVVAEFERSSQTLILNKIHTLTFKIR